jgi:adenine-specific DNA methylase
VFEELKKFYANTTKEFLIASLQEEAEPVAPTSGRFTVMTQAMKRP